MTYRDAGVAQGGLVLANLTRRYGARLVLDDVSLDVTPGRVRALVGENGAGKSTLIRVACGLLAPESGTVQIDGVALPAGDARAANLRGIGVVHQHFMLVDTMTVAENVALGHEPRRGPFGLLLDHARARAEVRALGERYGLRVAPDAIVGDLAVGERQRVELLKVLYRGAKFVLLDEPTAVLSPNEIAALLDVIRALVNGGAGVLFVSHKLDEVLAVADDVTVLRRAKRVLHKLRSESDAGEIARAVVGGDMPVSARDDVAVSIEDEGPGLQLDNARTLGLRDVTIAVRRGEVLGVAGVEGNGQRPLAHAIAGLTDLDSGTVRLDGENATQWSIAKRRARGLGFVPEDREATGLLAQLSIAENLALGKESVATGVARLSRTAIVGSAREVIEQYGIQPPDPEARVSALSGGNAQKVLIARELSRPLRALVVAQPTRGVDIGAAVEVHNAIRRARKSGVAVLLITSDLDELRALSSRVIVMRGGAVVGEMPVGEATDARLGPLMIGGGS